MVSFFKRLGEVITKHPWAFVALWVLALVISIPLLGVFMSNLKYDTTGFIPKDLGAIAAQDKFKEQFPGNSSNHILVVIQSDNKTTAMHFIGDLDAAVLADANVTNVTGTSSIYNIQRDAVVNMTPDLYRNLYDAMDNTSDGNKKLYNATDEVRNSSNGLYWLWDNVTKANDQFYKARKQIADSSAHLYSARDQVQGMAGIFFGVPAYYMNAYVQANSSGQDDYNSSIIADQHAKDFVNGGSFPDSSKPMALQYLSTFNGAWSAPSNYNSNPQIRAQNAINAAAPAVINGMKGSGQLSSDQAAMMQSVVSSMTLANYISSPSASIDNIVVGMAAAQGGVDRGSIQDIYNLGRNPSDGTIGNYVVNKAVESLRDSADGRNMSASDLQNATDMLHDAWNLGPTATKQDFDKYVLSKAEKGLNASEKQTVEEIWGWGRDPNDSVISSYVLREAGKDLNASENQTLAEVYALGRNASNDTIRNYIIGKTLDELNLTSNTTYFLALMSLDRNLTDDQLKDFARSWEASHGYDDPKILPDSVVSSLAAGKVTMYIVTTTDPESSTSASNSVKAIQDHVAGLAKDERYSGVKAYVTGATAISLDTKTSSLDDVNNIDKVTILLVLIILAVYFRSFLTPFIPLLITGIGVVVAFGFMGIVTTQIDVFYLVMTFMVVIMLGAGTDYCVFILSRYAEERSKGAEIKASVISSMEHAGKSIASSGTTAMIGFGSLMLIDKGIFRSIGIGTASAVLFCMLVALTLVPAVLAIAGDRLFWPKKLYMSGPSKLGKTWRAITHKVLKHSKAIFVIALLVTVPAIYIFSNLQLGDDFVSMMPDSYASKMGYDLMNSEFGSGALEKGMVVATLPENLTGPDGNYSAAALGRVEALSSMLAATPGVDKVYSMTRPEGVTIEYDNLSAYKGAEKEYYQNYMDNSTGIDGHTTVIYVAFNGSPYSDQAQKSTDAMNQELKAYEAENPGTALLLGGGSVGSYEYQKLCTDKYTLVIPVVLIGIFLVLLVLLRSVFTPARLIVTLLMSMFWALAAFILVFQYWLHASIYWMLPIILFCVLMGLGVDYDIFLVTRVREEVYKGKSDEEAIENAIESTGTIITLCGLVMASAFGSMMLSGTVLLKEFGFALCLAILLDATLMRLVIVPSIMVLMKKYNWWMPFVKDEQVQLASIPDMQKPK